MVDKPFQIIKKDETKLGDILEYFNNEYEEGRKSLDIRGQNLGQEMVILSSDYEYRFSQLQEIEAILEHFNIKLKQIKSQKYSQMLNTSARALSSTDMRQYIDGDTQVIAYQTIINEIVLVRNKFLSLSKGFESMQYMLNNITKLRVAGLDNIII